MQILNVIISSIFISTEEAVIVGDSILDTSGNNVGKLTFISNKIIKIFEGGELWVN